MARYTLEDGGYESDWSDKIEKYTAGLGLLSDAIGLGTAATGVGAPLGATIALVGNIPNFIVDGYQMGRDWWRYYQDGGSDNLGGALWNTAETGLDLLGGKLALKGAKVVNDRAFSKEVAGRIQDEIKKRQGYRFRLNKKGMTDAEIAAYILQKATNAATNSKDIIDSRKHRDAKTIQQGKIIGNILSATQNGYHLLPDALPNDATRVYRPLPIQLR
jgi:hypothetical protein